MKADQVPTPLVTAPGDASSSRAGLSWQDQAFLLRTRDELLPPINAIITFSEMLQEEAKDLPEPTFVTDLQQIQGSAKQLFELVQEFLAPAVIQHLTPEGLGVLQSRVRHDMLNALNPVVNYAEMWLEESDQPFLEEFLPDLRRIYEYGKLTIQILERIKTFRRKEPDGSCAPPVPPPPPVPIASLFGSDLINPEQLHVGEPGFCLVVDDNATNRDILCRLLVRQGHRVATATNGKEALAMLDQAAYDLILLDILMPEMNGFQVLDKIKADEKLREVPVIMISALDQDDSVVRCIAMGAEDYLPRPFNPMLLKARIGACLEKKRLRDREKLYLQQIELEKKRSDDLLRVILPDQIVEELRTTDEVKPRRYDNVAVLFADIVGFTPYCDQHPPEEVVAHLQKLVEMWELSAVRHEVEKIKTIGDAFMAACGLLRRVENPVLRCVRCGLEMIDLARGLPVGWNVRVGIHIGHVVAGVIGRRQYLFDLWGDTVNTAARMESHGLPGAINLSREAWGWIRENAWGQRRWVEVKGKGALPMIRFGGFLSPAWTLSMQPEETQA